MFGNKIPKEIYPIWSDGGDLGVKNSFFFFFGDGTSDENGRPLKGWWTSQSRVKQMIFRHGFETIAVSTKNDMAICFQVLKG